MSVQGSQVAVGPTTPVALNGAGSSYHGQSIAFWCDSALKLGGSDVAMSFAVLPANTPFAPDLGQADVVSVLSVSGTVTVNVFKVG